MLAHAGPHPAEGADDALCVVCLQGHSLEQLQHSAATAGVATPPAFNRPVLASQSVPAITKPAPQIRGPPNLFQN